MEEDMSVDMSVEQSLNHDLSIASIDDGMSDRGSAIGHSLPSPEEVKGTSGISQGATRRICIYILAGVLLVAIVLGISLGVTLGGGGEKEGSQLSAAQKASRRREAREYFIQQGISESLTFNFAGTPQNRALEFIAVEDARRLSVPSKSTDDNAYEFVTRYVLAVLYYATDGPSWKFRLNFVTDDHACDWFSTFKQPVGRVGVLCNERTRTITGVSMLYNKLKGKIPDEIGHLTTLTYVESVGNDIEGTIPETMKKLVNLDSLVLANNFIAGSIPEWIGDLKKMKFLYLSNNVMTGSVPSTFQNMKELFVTALDDNNFFGSADFLWQLPKLQYAFLGQNKFTGKMPERITQTSPNLIELDLSDNQFDGALPVDIFRLTKLKILDLHSNTFDGGIPSDINDNRHLQFLALYRNELTAGIPPTIGNLRNLTHLDLSHNKLQGEFPSELSELSGLTYLFLSENLFSEAPIPSYFYNFRRLRELSLKNTNRNGKILPVVSFLPELVMLDLDNNRLTGPIPPEMGDMPSLQFLLLNHNNLSGNVPTELANLRRLKFILIESNDLTGDMRPICNNTEVTLAAADCDELSCHCCMCCYDDKQPCHDNTLVANLDPLWERAYERSFYNFANSSSGVQFELDEDP